MILMNFLVLSQLEEARFVEVEQGRQFLWGATGEVLSGEGIDGEVFDLETPAPAHDLTHLLLAQVMALLLRHPTGEGEAAGCVHNDGPLGGGGDRAVLHPSREHAVVQQPEAALAPADQHGLVWQEIAPCCPCASYGMRVSMPLRHGGLSSRSIVCCATATQARPSAEYHHRDE